MRPYLDNYIRTLTRRRRERVANLLEESRVGKEQLSHLASVLRGQEELIPVDLSRDQGGFRINPMVTQQNVSLMRDSIEELFEISNIVSLLLNSEAAVLTSEIASLEQELFSMEKMAKNFAFLLSDNQAYDYAHLEAFNDEGGRGDIGTIPDRGGVDFGTAGLASIRPDEGVLSLPETLLHSHGLVGQIVRGNANAFTVQQTDLENVFTRGTSTGWRMTIASAAPITSSLKEARGRKGAQVVLDFSLQKPAPCSEIKLVPYADMATELVRVVIFEDEEDVGRDILDSPVNLERPMTVHFPVRPILRFRIVLNQPTYHRVLATEKKEEFQYRSLIESINKENKSDDHQHRKRRTWQAERLEKALMELSKRRGSRRGSTIGGVPLRDIISSKVRAGAIPSTELTPRWGPLSLDKLISRRFNRRDIWRLPSDRASLLFDLIKSEEDNDLNKISRRSGELTYGKLGRLLASDNPIFSVLEGKPYDMVLEQGFNYFYNIGLHFVGVGIENPGYKAAFVSKTLDSTGDMGQVRLKVDDSNYILTATDRHSAQLTSIEYSVSNHSHPNDESHWFPIMPVGEHSVKGERLILDEDGRGLLRFPALSETVHVYRNGYRVSISDVSWIQGQAGSIDGIKLDVFTVDDIFTCDYIPVGDPTVVSFESYGFDDVPPLASAHDETGSGESFISTGGRNTVSLSRTPYIDPQLASQGGYQPITVRLDNGVVAQNLTDYRENKFPSLPPDGYYYIHSGDMIMFNRPIRERFRVYYEYLQNNVRFRVVLRCNVKDFVSPKVDYVHLKAKTRLSDIRQPQIGQGA